MKNPKPNNILAKAQEIMDGNRPELYGKPEVSLGRVSNLWNAYLKSIDHKELNDIDIANMMILLKMARHIQASKIDNWVDIAGYAQLGANVDEKMVKTFEK